MIYAPVFQEEEGKTFCRKSPHFRAYHLLYLFIYKTRGLIIPTIFLRNNLYMRGLALNRSWHLVDSGVPTYLAGTWDIVWIKKKIFLRDGENLFVL